MSSAQTIASANMPATTTVQGHAAPLDGTVVPAANVVLGNWDTTASTFTSLAASGGTTPDAVQVTGLETSANGNPVAMFFGNVLGYATKDITATAIASYGTGQSFNTIVINDHSQSFLPDIASQRAADTAILNCIANAAGSASKFGITTINGSAWTYLPLTQASVSGNQTRINALTSCISPYTTSTSRTLCTEAGLSSSCSVAQLQAAYAASLASLTGGTGISLAAPSTAQISSTFAAFCRCLPQSRDAVCRPGRFVRAPRWYLGVVSALADAKKEAQTHANQAGYLRWCVRPAMKSRLSRYRFSRDACIRPVGVHLRFPLLCCGRHRRGSRARSRIDAPQDDAGGWSVRPRVTDGRDGSPSSPHRRRGGVFFARWLATSATHRTPIKYSPVWR